MSNLLPSAPEADRCESEGCPTPAIEAYPARTAELGKLTIRRVLPVRQRRVIGPWCFLDRYGPLTFTDGRPMDVGAHPHIGLQTVTWLLSGEVVHNDSLGSEALIRPGELSLMTSGRGITHTEQTPVKNSGTLNGVQFWVALPDAMRGTEPAYEHHTEMPHVELPGGEANVILGSFASRRSPGAAYSPTVGAELRVHPGERMQLPLELLFEHAILLLDGDLALEGRPIEMDTLYYLGTHRNELELASRSGARVLLVGGEPFQETLLMWWNFVARTPDEIAAARAAWLDHDRFPDVPGWRGERIDAPEYIPRLSRPA
jgi:redox-sensitive bicupin YhaK (pirin superfamily)